MGWGWARGRVWGALAWALHAGASHEFWGAARAPRAPRTPAVPPPGPGVAAGSGRERDALGLQPSLRGCTMAFCLRGCPGNIPPSQFPSNMKPPRGCLPGAQSLGLLRGAALAPFPAPPTLRHMCTERAGAQVGGGRLPAQPGFLPRGRNQGSARNGAMCRPLCARMRLTHGWGWW